MAQWQELLKLDSALQNQVRQLYEGRFPIEIRHWLSNWIEIQDCKKRNLRLYLRHSCQFVSNFAFQENFQAQPMNLAALLSECLKEEKKILASVTATLELKKEVKTLEGLNEKLHFIQKMWQSKGLAGDHAGTVWAES
ncbi:hypothetical protein GOODEAATRI_016374 [Goodea atripinnis]|uniref:STAT transcription factor protein interaction domain-containing protein n=1 Tax=Goodea atripinnis TaxID=208336 RepID=A0ABV0MSK5_9TELE